MNDLLLSSLLKRKIKVHPTKQKYTENCIENNTNFSNTRLLFLKEQEQKYLSYEEIDFPSHPISINNENMKKNDDNNVLSSCNLSNNLISEENVINNNNVFKIIESNNNMKKIDVKLKMNWFEEIKKLCFNLVGKINTLKNNIVKDHWKEDNTTKCCSFCRRKFTMFFRRHHCRICGNIFCSSCSSGRTLLDPNLAMPVQFVAATTSSQFIKYDRSSGGFEFDGFEYNYLDYEEVNQEQQQFNDREHEKYWNYHQQKQKQLEFDENHIDDYYNNFNHDDEHSITNSSDYSNSSDSSSSSSGSTIDLNNVTTCDLIYDDDGDSSNDNNYGSEPVCERVCINCHKVFGLDENDWCCH